MESVVRLSNHVIRILGQNPGKFTLQGTNTYLIGRQNPYILIDTGEGLDGYIPVLESVFHDHDLAKPFNLTQPDVSDIIISHWHHDHVGGLPSVLSMLRRQWDERKSGLPYQPPRLHKFPLASETPGTHILSSIITSLPQDLFTPAPNGSVFNDIQDGQHLPVSSMPPLHLLHTPGHTPDSVSIYLPFDRALYTSDSVLGQGTAVFDNLTDYMSSLRRMLEYVKAQEQDQLASPISLYPGHGPVLQSGADTLNTYIQHRLERESQIISVLQGTPPTAVDSGPGDWTTWAIVTIIYAAYPEPLWLPAMRGIDLHLKKLEADGVVTKLGGDGKESRWKLTNGA